MTAQQRSSINNLSARPRRRRTFVAVAAAVASIALLSSGCSSSDQTSTKNPSRGSGDKPLEVNPDNCPVDALAKSDTPVEITVWHAYTALTQQALETAATEYNASQSRVKVNVEAQGGYEELLKKYEDRLADPSSLPDVVFSEDTTLRFLVDSGSVIPSGDCIAADPDSAKFYDDLLPVVRNTYSIKKVLWPAAFGVSIPVMYVNNDHLRAAGVSTSPYPGTLDEVREAAKKIKAAKIAKVDEPVVMELYGWYPENWLTGAGQTIVNESNGHDGLATKSTFDNKNTKTMLEWFSSMGKEDLLKGYPRNTGIDQYLALGNQTSSILIDGSRAITSVNAIISNAYKGDAIPGAEDVNSDALKGLDISVAPVPGIKEAGQGSAAGSAAYVVAGTEPAEIAASWDFLKYFNTAPVQVQWTIEGSYLPVTKSVQKDPKIVDYFANDPAGKWLSIANDQVTNANPDFAAPVIGPYDQFRSGLQSILDEIVLNGAEVEPTLAAFDSKFQSQLDAYAKEIKG